MRKHVAVATLLVLSIACASVGTGDPVVVRAEDALTNGLTFYATAMDWHLANSTKESLAVYKILEKFRLEFPNLWLALDNAKRDYQRDKSTGTATLDARLNALAALIATVTPYITGGQ